MKVCLQQNTLQAYLDRELAREPSDGVAAHLAECPDCAARVREVEGAWIAINHAISSSLPETAPTTRLGARLESALTERRAARLSLSSLLSWKLAAALTAGVLALLLPTILKGTSEPPREALVAPTPHSVVGPQSLPRGQMQPRDEHIVVQRVEKRSKRVRHRVSRTASVQAEVATGFYSLVEDDELTPLESGRVVRVEVPASTFISFGLPVTNEARTMAVQADLLLGQDGLARAIRFVPAQTTRAR